MGGQTTDGNSDNTECWCRLRVVEALAIEVADILRAQTHRGRAWIRLRYAVVPCTLELDVCVAWYVMRAAQT